MGFQLGAQEMGCGEAAQITAQHRVAWRLEVLYPSQGVAGKETVTVPRDP